MLAVEGLDPCPGVGRGHRVGTENTLEHGAQHPRPGLGIVQKGVPGARVFLDVVRDLQPLQGGVERGRDTASAAAAISANPSAPKDDASAVPVAKADANSQAAAISVAEKVVTAFGRPGLDYQPWINGRYPLLTQTGAAAYEDTDPANVPVHQVTGAGTILPGSTNVALIVKVPTDAGPYTVSLSRPGSTAPWLADRIRPAQG